MPTLHCLPPRGDVTSGSDTARTDERQFSVAERYQIVCAENRMLRERLMAHAANTRFRATTKESSTAAEMVAAMRPPAVQKPIDIALRSPRPHAVPPARDYHERWAPLQPTPERPAASRPSVPRVKLDDMWSEAYPAPGPAEDDVVLMAPEPTEALPALPRESVMEL